MNNNRPPIKMSLTIKGCNVDKDGNRIFKVERSPSPNNRRQAATPTPQFAVPQSPAPRQRGEPASPQFALPAPRRRGTPSPRQFVAPNPPQRNFGFLHHQPHHLQSPSFYSYAAPPAMVAVVPMQYYAPPQPQPSAGYRRYLQNMRISANQMNQMNGSAVQQSNQYQPIDLERIPEKDLHAALLQLIVTEKERKKSGFVYYNEDGDADVQQLYSGTEWVPAGESLRKCSRCHHIYHIDKWKARCELPDRSTYPYHVNSSTDRSELENFEKTPEAIGSEEQDNRSRSVLAIDTEMVYTTLGLEVARVTVVGARGAPLWDNYIKPIGQVIDLNSQFSGVTAQHLKTAMDLETARAFLFTLINQKTILVGHHIANDLKVLRVIHDKVVDTAILFKSGGKYPALRKLAALHLGDRIQRGAHDSGEDAKVCLKIIAKKFPWLMMEKRNREQNC